MDSAQCSHFPIQVLLLWIFSLEYFQCTVDWTQGYREPTLLQSYDCFQFLGSTPTYNIDLTIVTKYRPSTLVPHSFVIQIRCLQPFCQWLCMVKTPSPHIVCLETAGESHHSWCSSAVAYWHNPLALGFYPTSYHLLPKVAVAEITCGKFVLEIQTFWRHRVRNDS